MPNRVGVFSTFAGIAPPWSLPNLDGNFAAITTAFNDASLGYNNYIATDTGSANNYVVTCAFGTPTANNAGMLVIFKPANSNTGASTITITGIAGSVNILRPDGSACIGGEIVAGVSIALVSNGTAFLIASLPWIPFSPAFQVLAANQAYNCQNASMISIVFNYTAAITVTLNNLSIGMTVNLVFVNTGSGALLLKLAATLPGGTAYTNISTKLSGASTGFGNNWLTGVNNNVNVGNVLSMQSYLSGGNALLQGVNS